MGDSKWCIYECNENWQIVRVLNQVMLTLELEVGDFIAKVIAESDLEKFFDFTAQVNKTGSHFGCNLVTHFGREMRVLQYGGMRLSQKYILLVYDNYLELFEGLMAINNEQSNLIRERMKSYHSAFGQLDQMSALNNSIVNLQRDLVKKNKEVEQLLQKQEQLNLQLLRANKMKDRLFSIIGHDLRGPLGNVITYLKFAISSMKQTDENAEMLHLAQGVTRSAGSALVLLENLLMWSKGNFEDNPCFYEYLNLPEMVSSLLMDLDEDIRRKEIHVDLTELHELEVLVDKNVLSTSLRNVLSNAIKFSYANSSVTLRAKRYNQVSGDRMVEISIQDTGVGFSQEQIETLFNNEFGHSTLGTSGEKGTGFGLALCNQLLQHMCSTLAVESNANGSKVTILINETQIERQ